MSQPPTKRVILCESISQELHAGTGEFVEQFVPQNSWPEARPESPIYKATMESLQVLTGSAVRQPEAEVESHADDDEDPVFIRRRWQQ